MASSDEYQQIQFWERPKESSVVVFLDIAKPANEQPFCTQVKLKKHGKNKLLSRD